MGGERAITALAPLWAALRATRPSALISQKPVIVARPVTAFLGGPTRAKPDRDATGPPGPGGFREAGAEPTHERPSRLWLRRRRFAIVLADGGSPRYVEA